MQSCCGGRQKSSTTPLSNLISNEEVKSKDG
jgi:hypothetical protein